jgi:uncharacterized membrane protein
MKTRHLILLFLWGAIALQCVYFFPLLPGTVASHFDGAGRANGASSRETFFALYLGIAGLITFAFFALPVLLRHVPASVINLPHREYWLTPARIEQALAMLDEEMGWFGNGVLLMIGATMQLAINANLPGAVGFDTAVMWSLLAGFILFTSIWLVRLYRRFAIPT